MPTHDSDAEGGEDGAEVSLGQVECEEIGRGTKTTENDGEETDDRCIEDAKNDRCERLGADIGAHGFREAWKQPTLDSLPNCCKRAAHVSLTGRQRVDWYANGQIWEGQALPCGFLLSTGQWARSPYERRSHLTLSLPW